MPYGLYISAEGAHAQSRRMDVIAHNMANVDTVGFKRELALFQARNAQAIDDGRTSAGSGGIDDVGGGVMLAETHTDFTPGPMKLTGSQTDMALAKDGFFLVKNGEENYLTRAGNFRLTNRGELVTQQGHAVLTETGTPVQLPRPELPWTVSPTGEIRQSGEVQRLAVVRPQSMGDLVRVGENLFRPLADPRPVEPAAREVASGYLEMSGVQPTTEMVELIEASRAVEANVNMIQTQDQMLSGLVTRVLRVN